jgi:hypothetical protein
MVLKVMGFVLGFGLGLGGFWVSQLNYVCGVFTSSSRINTDPILIYI